MYIGKPLRRDEDLRFLTGRGSYTDDMQLPNQCYAAFLRSPHAHARIRAISIEAALGCPGVLAVLTGKDWKAAGLGALPSLNPVPSSDGRPMNDASRPVLCLDKVCHVGDTVALAVAETPCQALDAAEAVEIDYEPLPAVVDIVKALDPGAPLVHREFGTNLVYCIEHGDKAATEAAFARADHVTELAMRNPKITGMPMEPRSYVAQHDAARDHYTLWAACQQPHLLRRLICKYTLFIPEHRIRIVAPDVGGGFGTKGFYYPEMPALLWAAKRLGRPVRWTGTRSETVAVDCHARDHATQAKMAFDKEGRILGIQCETIAGFGAYQSTFAAMIPGKYYPPTMTGFYKIPTAYVKVIGVYTNTTPIDALRGSTTSSTTVRERLIENGARELAIDPAVLRARNYIGASEYPYKAALGPIYESGDPPGQQAKMLELAGYAALLDEQRDLRRRGIRMGIGMAGIIEGAGMGPSRAMAADGYLFGTSEVANVHVHDDGNVSVYVGTHSHGQSHDITFRQIAADSLQLDIRNITLLQGDTSLGPGVFGTGAARSLSTAGMAIVEASRRVIAKATKLAAHMLECAAVDIEYRGAQFIVRGTDRELPFAAVAEMAYYGASYPEEGFELGLNEMVFYDPSHFNYPTALHLAVVLVDEDTGVVRVRDYYCVDDCGRVINPMVVHGQVHGGLAQGIGQALIEQLAYDPESGQLLSASFMDYAMPRADMLPSYSLAFQETLNPHNALGVKGCSESGVCGAPAAIANGIVDALWDLGIRQVTLPYTAEKVWRLIQSAKAQILAGR